MAQKKYLSSRARLVSRKPLLFLEFNKPNKQNVWDINYFNKFNFSQSQNNCWHTDWCRELQNIKHQNKHITLFSDANVPVRFRTQQCKQNTAHYSSRLTVSQLKGVSDTILNWFENHRPQRTQISTVTGPLLRSGKTWIEWPPGWPQSQVFRAYFFNSCNIQGNIQALRLTGLLWWQKLTRRIQHFLQDIVDFRSSILLSL